MEEDDKKCYNCGKIFQSQSKLARHKNKRSPCLIHELKPGDENNPNRCIFCNKIFANVSNMKKHFIVCKVRNGNMNVLHDKVEHERKVGQLSVKSLADEVVALKRIVLDLTTKLQNCQLEPVFAHISGNNSGNISGNNSNNVNSGNTINIVQNFAPQIVYNSYLEPSLDGIRITEDDIRQGSIPSVLLHKVYFNPDLPENHVIHLGNQGKLTLLYHDKKWEIASGNKAVDVFENIKDRIKSFLMYKLVNDDGIGSDSKFPYLDRETQDKIFQYNARQKVYTIEEFVGDLLAKKEISQAIIAKVREEIAQQITRG